MEKATMSIKRLVILSMVAAGLLLGIQSASHAALVLSLNDNDGHIVTVADGGVGDLNVDTGVITYLGSLGVWRYNVTTGFSKPLIGTAAYPNIDLNSVNLSSTMPGKLSITITDTGFTGSGMDYMFDIGGTTSGSIIAQAFYTDQTGTTRSTTFLGPYGHGAFSGSTSGSINAVGAYNLGITIDITHPMGTGLISSFDAQFQAVPVPPAVYLLGAGLLGLVGLRRRLNK
jgi:hypothetical protein